MKDIKELKSQAYSCIEQIEAWQKRLREAQAQINKFYEKEKQKDVVSKKTKQV